jgi:hypothetical protein
VGRDAVGRDARRILWRRWRDDFLLMSGIWVRCIRVNIFVALRVAVGSLPYPGKEEVAFRYRLRAGLAPGARSSQARRPHHQMKAQKRKAR